MDDNNILDQEQETPALEVVTDNTTYVHKFAEPFEYEGKKYPSLTFRFGNMKGKDVLAITQELRSRGIVLVTRNFEVDYQYRYAVQCCEENIGNDLLLALPVKDFDAICQAVQRFLVSMGR